jgi:ankyrin repeat protein
MPPNNSALHWAAWENAIDVMAELLKHKAVQVDVLNGADETPLMIAAHKGNTALMRQLFVAGAYPNKEGWTPLHYAALTGNLEAIKLLLDEHAYIDAESPNKTTPLMMAAKSKQILAVKLLLDEGADFEAKNEAGWTVITFAEKADAKDIVEGLKLREAALKARHAKPALIR